MPEPLYAIVLRDASLIDIDEIKGSLPKTDLQVLQPTGADETHNELATILLLSLTKTAIVAFTLWLLRNRDTENVEYDAVIRRPDGTETTVRLKIRRNSSSAPDAQATQQIADALDVPVERLLSTTLL
jgi:hypothetical protein